MPACLCLNLRPGKVRQPWPGRTAPFVRIPSDSDSTLPKTGVGAPEAMGEEVPDADIPPSRSSSSTTPTVVDDSSSGSSSRKRPAPDREIGIVPQHAHLSSKEPAGTNPTSLPTPACRGPVQKAPRLRVQHSSSQQASQAPAQPPAGPASQKGTPEKTATQKPRRANAR